MKAMKTIAVIAVTMALVLNGCENSFSGNTADRAAIAEYNDAKYSGSLTTPVLGPVFGLTNAANQYITIGFDPDDGIDEATIVNAVKIYKLENAANAWDAYKATSLTYSLFSYKFNGVKDLATFKVDLTGSAQTLEVTIDATILTGRNGSKKLNLDFDEIQGEAIDDMFVGSLVVGGSAPALTTGLLPAPQATMTKAGIGFTLSTAVNCTYNLTLGYVDLNEDYTNLLKANTAIQLYDITNNSWSDVSGTTIERTGANTYLYTFGSAKAGSSYRLLNRNGQAFVTTGLYAGFVRKLYTKNTDVVKVEATASLGDVAESAADPFGAATVYKDAAGKVMYIDMPVSFGVTGALGFIESSVSADNIKLYNATKAVFVPVTSITMLQSSTSAAATDPKDTVRIVVNTSITGASDSINVFLGPGLKALGATTANTDDIHFGDFTQKTKRPFGFREYTGKISL